MSLHFFNIGGMGGREGRCNVPIFYLNPTKNYTIIEPLEAMSSGPRYNPNNRTNLERLQDD